MADRDDAVYVISVAAELAGMHPQTLRTYERKGLVEPERTSGNTRRYSARDIDRLKLISHLTQEEGLNLAGVRLVIQLYEQMEQLRVRAEELERELDETVTQLRQQLSRAQRQGRYEIVPVRPGQVEPHPDFPRSIRRTPDRRRDRRREEG